MYYFFFFPFDLAGLSSAHSCINISPLSSFQFSTRFPLNSAHSLCYCISEFLLLNSLGCPTLSLSFYLFCHGFSESRSASFETCLGLLGGVRMRYFQTEALVYISLNYRLEMFGSFKNKMWPEPRNVSKDL